MSLTAQDLARMGPAARKQILEKLGSAQAKERKYHNEPVSMGKLHFDSKKEARRYEELMLLLRAGKIRNLRLQAQYTLQESYITPEGDRVRAIRYVADFAYERVTAQPLATKEPYGCGVPPAGTAPDVTGTVYWLPVVEDVKSTATRTDKYKIKAKLLKERYGLTITEV